MHLQYRCVNPCFLVIVVFFLLFSLAIVVLYINCCAAPRGLKFHLCRTCIAYLTITLTLADLGLTCCRLSEHGCSRACPQSWSWCCLSHSSWFWGCCYNWSGRTLGWSPEGPGSDSETAASRPYSPPSPFQTHETDGSCWQKYRKETVKFTPSLQL